MNSGFILSGKTLSNLYRIQRLVILAGGTAAVLLKLFLLFSTFVVILDARAEGRSFCLSKDCLDEAGKLFAAPVESLTLLGNFLVGFATVLSLVVALRVYLTNAALVQQTAASAELQAKSLEKQAESLALQLHAARFKSFRDYVTDEIGRCARINVSSVDVTTWYYKIFTSNYQNGIQANEQYLEAMNRIAQAMRDADARLGPVKNRFNHYKHQSLLIPLFKEVGIHLNSLPRLDYFLIEDEVVGLIHAVHRVFDIPQVDFGERVYRQVG